MQPPTGSRRLRARRPGGDYVGLGVGSRLAGVAGLVLMLSPLMDWYTGSGDGLTIGVIGWHTGTAGKLVFFLGLVVVLVVVLHETGIQLPASVPESLILIAAGALATIFVLIRVISVPERFIPWNGRGVGIWVALAAAIAVVLGGVIQANDDL